MKKLTLFLLGLIGSFAVIAQEERTYGYPTYNQPAPANVRIVSSRTVGQNTVLANRAEATSRKDNIAPTISISSPATGVSYTVGTNVAITISASDNVGVTRVDLKVNNVTKYTKTAAPWSFTWATTGLTAASYTITATAYDAAGNNKTSTAITIKLTTPTTPPVTTDTTKPNIYSGPSPINYSIVQGTGLTAYAGVPDTFRCGVIEEVSLANVKWYVNSVLKATQPGFSSPTVIATFQYIFIPDTVIVNRPYSQPTTATITAVATDAAGNTVTKSFVRTVAVVYKDTTRYASKYRLACPPVINQGGEGSCVTMATAYYAFSINQYYKTGASSYNYSTNVFSPEYAHDIFTTSPNMTGCGFNASTPTGLLDQILIPRGCCLYSSLPYSSFDIGCQTTSTLVCTGADSCVVTDAMRAEAANYKAKNYVVVKTYDTGTIKYFLARNHAIITGFSVPGNWNQNGQDSNFVLNCSTWDGCQITGHAITVVGWDDVRQAFLIVNSWGTGWGFGGYAWIGYDWFANSNRAYCPKLCSSGFTRYGGMSIDAYVIDPFEY